MSMGTEIQDFEFLATRWIFKI